LSDTIVNTEQEGCQALPPTSSGPPAANGNLPATNKGVEGNIGGKTPIGRPKTLESYPRGYGGGFLSRHTRVTKTSPCPICGEPDWCVVSNNGNYALCQRVESDVRRGEAGWLHRLNDTNSTGELDNSPPSDYNNGAPLTASENADYPLASPDRVHSSYSNLLDSLALAPGHSANLHSRGLSGDTIAFNQYRSLPAGDRCGLATKVASLGKVAGVPGFYKGSRGVDLSGQAGLLVPVRNLSQLVVGLQIRRDDYDGQGGKYVWLSSAGLPFGCSPGAPVHVAMPPDIATTQYIFVTEGALKADIIAQFSGAVAIGIPGVTMWRRAIPILVDLLPLNVVLAFDNDRHSNEFVERSYEAFKQAILDNHFNCYVALWPVDIKGLDDWLNDTGGKAPLRLQTIYKATLDNREKAPLPYYKESLVNSYNLENEAKKPATIKTIAERLSELPTEVIKQCQDLADPAAIIDRDTWLGKYKEWEASRNKDSGYLPAKVRTEMRAILPYKRLCEGTCGYARCEKPDRLNCEAYAWAVVQLANMREASHDNK